MSVAKHANSLTNEIGKREIAKKNQIHEDTCQKGCKTNQLLLFTDMNILMWILSRFSASNAP